MKGVRNNWAWKALGCCTSGDRICWIQRMGQRAWGFVLLYLDLCGAQKRWMSSSWLCCESTVGKGVSDALEQWILYLSMTSQNIFLTRSADAHYSESKVGGRKFCCNINEKLSVNNTEPCMEGRRPSHWDCRTVYWWMESAFAKKTATSTSTCHLSVLCYPDSFIKKLRLREFQVTSKIPCPWSQDLL